MKVPIFSIEGERKAEIDLPEIFGGEIREDLIAKVFRAESAAERQPYGSYIFAGKRASAPGKIKHQRRRWKGAYGRGISRVPRKVLSRRGSQFFWQGAFAPGTVKGRAAHPPKIEKKWEIKINKKEREKALRAALAATASEMHLREKYKMNGITLPELPIVVENKIEELTKVKELRKALESILKTDKFFPERSIRAGKGKMRARRHKKTAGLLLVVSNTAKIKDTKAFGVKEAAKLRVSDLAPGGSAGRVVLYSEAALEELVKKFEE